VQQPELLCPQRGVELVHAGAVAAWPRHADDETDADRIIGVLNTIGIVAVAALAAQRGWSPR
jgi:hypothetical protein